MSDAVTPTSGKSPGYISIANYRTQQTFKSPNPPWVCLHAKLLDSYKFTSMSLTARLIYLELLVLASRLGIENVIPADLAWLSAKLVIPCTADHLAELREAGFVTDAAPSIAAHSEVDEFAKRVMTSLAGRVGPLVAKEVIKELFDREATDADLKRFGEVARSLGWYPKQRTIDRKKLNRWYRRAPHSSGGGASYHYPAETAAEA